MQNFSLRIRLFLSRSVITLISLFSYTLFPLIKADSIPTEIRFLRTVRQQHY